MNLTLEKMKKKKGFTLIELMVVISIILVLASF
ncbi:putative pilin [Clostridium botulinum CFSAN001628]|nr:putative pilin [Clostridium botulinum CFSAN001628]